MINITKEERKKLNRIYILSALIVFIASIEALFIAKNSELLNNFLKVNPSSNSSEYIIIVLMNYLMNILEPIIISLFTLFSFNKFGISKLYKYVFSIIIFLRLIFIIITFSLNSIFYYLMIVLYLIFLYVILTLPQISRRRKNGLL